MDTLTIITELISAFGFPIFCVLALGWFIWRIYRASEKREEQLRAEIKENQTINAEAIHTLSLYAEKLDTIQSDIAEIKNKLTQ